MDMCDVPAASCQVSQCVSNLEGLDLLRPLLTVSPEGLSTPFLWRGSGKLPE